MATILILDDHDTNREFLITLLGYGGHVLLGAADAEAALSLVREKRPDLVIADVLMPVVDGFEFVRRLRDEPAIASTRVIFYTAAYMKSEVHALAEACGVSHVLTKPAEPEQIIATVQAVLGQPAQSGAPLAAETFAQEHQRLLLDKLAQKIDELESLNAGLEQRVAARTAELAEANVRLRELNTFKDNMLAITSHDLRSPLGGIQNLAELLLEEPGLPEDIRSMHQSIYNSARHLIDMVSKLLDLAQLEAGKVVLDLAELRASEVARRALETLDTSARAKQIATRLVIEPGETPVYADWVKLSQILMNLVGNAIKFTPAAGHITVTVGPGPYGVRISVADSGLGIPAEQLPQLFEKFSQIHRRGTAGERGSGLGLAIVRQLIELHGGSIEVASEPQRGSVFVVHLPAAGSTTR